MIKWSTYFHDGSEGDRMHALDYQAQAMKFKQYSNFDYPFLALPEEAGEVMGKLAKAVRKQHKDLGTLIQECREGKQEALRDGLIQELGDTLWQLTACLDAIGYDLNKLQHNNLSNLTGRAQRGTLVGEGDNR